MFRLNPHVVNVVEKMMRCREPEGLGYHKYACPDHPEKVRIIPHSCKTSICSCCAKIQNDIWSEKMKQTFPKTQYLHATLTIPKEFRDFFGKEDYDWQRKSVMYGLGWQVIQGFCKHQKGITTGCLIVLHTFGRALNINPHLHIVLPAGGLKFDRETGKQVWQKLEHISKAYLSKAWKNNLLHYILGETPYFKERIDQIMSLVNSKALDDYSRLLKLVKQLAPASEQTKWLKVFEVSYYVNVGKKRAYSQTICYVARYTRRLPIAKSRITAYSAEEESVTWKYQPHDSKTPVFTTMHPHIFIDRIIQHIRPKNFRLVRYYGIFASRKKAKFKAMLKKLCQFDEPQLTPSWRERQILYFKEDPLICPCCKKELQLVEKAFYNRYTGGITVIDVSS